MSNHNSKPRSLPISESTLTEQVKHVAVLMAREAHLDDSAIVDMLVGGGFTELQAARLNAFVPHAFGRLLLQSKHKPEFRPDFLLERDDGLRVRIYFSREPIMKIATKLAQEWATADPDNFGLVANRSSEVNAAKVVCDWDGAPAPIEFTEAVIVGIDPCEYGHLLTKRRWWKFW